MAYCRIEVIPRSWSLATLAGGLKNDLLMTVPYPQLHNWEQSKTSRETNQAPLQMQMNVEDSSHMFLHYRILAVNHRQLFLGLFCFLRGFTNVVGESSALSQGVFLDGYPLVPLVKT